MSKSQKPKREPPKALKEFTDLHKEWFDETNRGVVLTAAAYVDDRFKELIKSYLIDNAGLKTLFSGQNPPLGTFSNRTAAAFALGLISEREYKMADSLRQIRNEFAHKIVVRYTDEKISHLIINLVRVARQNNWSPRPKKVEEDLALEFRSVTFEFALDLSNRTSVPLRRLAVIDWEAAEE